MVSRISSTISPLTATTSRPPVSAATIREAEKLLKKAGFQPGTVDGRTSPAFTQAVREFQGAWGLPATGEVDGRTLSKLKATVKSIAAHKKDDLYVSVGQKGTDIKTLEQRLRSLGYDVGKADGVYSRQTAAAVKKFKRDQPEIKNDSGALGKHSRKVLRHEVKALSHAPERRRLAPTKARRRADGNTAQAVVKRHADGTVGLREGDRGGAVKNVQKHLKAAGFDPQHANGVFDERTRGALEHFQRKAGLDVTGRVDARTWKTLKKSFILSKKPASPAQALHERSGAVKASEKLLKKLGFNPGRLDGLFDRNTQHAVKAFEKKHKLKRDGQISAGELAKMKKLAKRRGGIQVTAKMRQLAASSRRTALSMGGYSGQGFCARGVRLAILKTYGINVWANGNTMDNNLPRSRFRQVHMSLKEALKIPGLVLTWEKTPTRLGSLYGHTAITLGDGRSSASDFVERNTAYVTRYGLKIFVPIK